MTTTLHRTPTVSLAADSIIANDGTIWSHAATLGTRFKGTEFTIDQATIENFVRVFSSGYPQKIPVDYEHGTTNGATSMGTPVPKAGDVLELKGVFAASEFTGELKAAAEKLAEKAGRSLDDARNLGLWMRWRPTKRALGMIQEGEYSELSIAFDEDLAHNVTGKGQGAALLAVALTNLPFLDDMLPVAASRDHGGSPAAPGQREHTMGTKITMLAAAAALFGKPVVDEDQAVVELTALQGELPKLRSFAKDVAAEIGESDPAKAVEKVKALKATATAAETAAKQAKEKEVATLVEATMKTHEKKLTVPMRALMASQLTRELTAGAKVEETETVKALTTMPELGITDRASAPDIGGANTGADVKLDAKAKELMNTDAEVKELKATRGFSAAFSLALSKAGEQLGLGKK